MDPTTIACADCRAPRLAKIANTKYCHVCRLLRDAKFVGSTVTKCFVCDKTFARVVRRDTMCASCDDLRRSYNVDGTCGLCKQPGVLWRAEVAICVSCLRDPEKRGPMIRALQHKQRLQKEAHA